MFAGAAQAAPANEEARWACSRRAMSSAVWHVLAELPLSRRSRAWRIMVFYVLSKPHVHGYIGINMFLELDEDGYCPQ